MKTTQPLNQPLNVNTTLLPPLPPEMCPCFSIEQEVKAFYKSATKSAVSKLHPHDLMILFLHCVNQRLPLPRSDITEMLHKDLVDCVQNQVSKLILLQNIFLKECSAERMELLVQVAKLCPTAQPKSAFSINRS